MSEWDKSKALRGKRARTRIYKAQGRTGGTLSGSHTYPEIARLLAEGWPKKDIAKYLSLTDRRVNQIIAQFEARTSPTERAQTPDIERMRRWTVDAFEEFFVRFSNENYLPAHTRPWIEAFLRERNLLLNVPPRHAKSILFSTWIPIWLICRDRNVQILLVSETHEFAKRWASEISGQLEYNQDLVSAFGRFKPENVGDQPWAPARGALSVMGRTRKAKGAQLTVQSVGMSTQVLGMEADFVMVDDPTNQEISASDTERKNQLKHLREQVFSRAEPQGDRPGGRIVVVGQRVHLLDLYGELEKQEYEMGDLRGQKLFHTEKTPAVLDWDRREVLWPQRFSWEEMMLTYARVGGHGPFSCLYQQQPMPEGSALVTLEWIKACRDYNRAAGVGPRGEMGDGAFLPITRILSVDPSPTKFNGIVVGDLLHNKENFVFSVMHVAHMRAGVRELMTQVDGLIAEFKPDYFIFEESGFLAWFRDDPWFVNLKDRVKLILHKTGVNKNNAEYGVQSLASDFEFERISLPYGDEAGRRMSDLLSGEALMYPDGDTNDLLMALWFVKFNYKKLSPLRFLPTRVRGAGVGGGWSWMHKMRERKDTQDAAYKRFQKEKAKRREELSKVG